MFDARLANRAVIILIVFCLASPMMLLRIEARASSPDDSYVKPANVIDPALERRLASSGDLEIIVQFHKDVRYEDRMAMRDMGFTVKHTFKAIPAVYAIGSPSAVRALAEYPRTYWIEYNERLTYMMNETTTTINSSKVLETKIIDKSGLIRQYNIDGTGVTAVVCDSGIDAGHPDLDYKEKTIINMKSDSDLVWVEMENTDTSSGHGTHCAGTIAGNGDASGGAKAGVAPGAKLIGLSTGEAVAIINALGALEWVYENSKPNNNPHNIRVVSNSWGSTEVYNPEDSICAIIRKLTYENNVVVVFAAGNEGTDDQDGATVTTNPYSLEPAALCIAAHNRLGTGMASFSSRGKATLNFTWPDFGAPGVNIYSTEARRTMISVMVKQGGQTDAYYMAISGTSMATPHVAGVVSLLWQACPSMRVMDMHDDFNGYEGPRASANSGRQESNGSAEYWNSNETRIHEAEFILKATANYIEPKENNNVPTNHSIGILGKPYDYAQGYGLVDVEKAVAFALTLQELRRQNPEATVYDALEQYNSTIQMGKMKRSTDTLNAYWTGEWSWLASTSGAISSTNQTKLVYVPEDASKLVIDLQYAPMKTDDGMTLGSLYVTLDLNCDGSPDWTGASGFTMEGKRTEEIDVTTGEFASARGKYWGIDIKGQGFKFGRPNIFDLNEQYREALIEYAVSAEMIFSGNSSIFYNLTDYHPGVAQMHFSTPTVGGKTITKNQNYFNLSGVEYKPKKQSPHAVQGLDWCFVGTLLAIVALVSVAYMMRDKIQAKLKVVNIDERMRKLRLK